ncbi:hypothetical protein [Paenibacillus alginolyticus]|uniref:Uncharacterized protein n=1 Tax=Paenibacillus alginolyticus TaxID=59839 RepID=A0ABT4GDW5_9BACL|nr:hypothetical protein [Paenibacillus alginolyticus]MCY9694373.1 hypothetical protein [Paenibacillus alginolyticus]MEC0147542.1 hypothetical protein [Paenibacillus alginolyticus]
MDPSRFLVIGDLYNCLFAVQSSNHTQLVDYVIWNRVKASLPKDYMLPDLLVLHAVTT